MEQDIHQRVSQCLFHLGDLFTKSNRCPTDSIFGGYAAHKFHSEGRNLVASSRICDYFMAIIRPFHLINSPNLGFFPIAGMLSPRRCHEGQVDEVHRRFCIPGTSVKIRALQLDGENVVITQTKHSFKTGQNAIITGLKVLEDAPSSVHEVVQKLSRDHVAWRKVFVRGCGHLTSTCVLVDLESDTGEGIWEGNVISAFYDLLVPMLSRMFTFIHLDWRQWSDSPPSVTLTSTSQLHMPQKLLPVFNTVANLGIVESRRKTTNISYGESMYWPWTPNSIWVVDSGSISVLQFPIITVSRFRSLVQSVIWGSCLCGRMPLLFALCAYSVLLGTQPYWPHRRGSGSQCGLVRSF